MPSYLITSIFATTSLALVSAYSLYRIRSLSLRTAEGLDDIEFAGLFLISCISAISSGCLLGTLDKLVNPVNPANPVNPLLEEIRVNPRFG